MLPSAAVSEHPPGSAGHGGRGEAQDFAYSQDSGFLLLIFLHQVPRNLSVPISSLFLCYTIYGCSLPSLITRAQTIFSRSPPTYIDKLSSSARYLEKEAA